MKAVLGKLNDELLINVASRAGGRCSRVEVAVAYAEKNDFFKTCRDQGLKLTFYGLLDHEGAVSPALLRELLAWGPSKADCRLVKGNFHPKVIWWHGYGAYIGSANLTHKAWFHNIEVGVFFEQKELLSNGVGAELEAMFEHLAKHHVPVTEETVAKLEDLAREREKMRVQNARLLAKFEDLFGHVAPNPAMTVAPAKGHKENRAEQTFSLEWSRTLQTLRGLAVEFDQLGARPQWVRQDAHRAIHFDQFLHGYYYKFVRESLLEEDDDELSSRAKVETFFGRHRANPKAALEEGAEWWSSLSEPPFDEDHFIHEVAPGMRRSLSREALAAMTSLEAFTEAVRPIKSLRMHARQVKNVEFGLPPDHRENLERRVERLCEWLWRQRTSNGMSVRDVLEFVLWGDSPNDMERRLWLAISDPRWRLDHFGRSMLGEAIGWARPNDYPPRNNRTNKALRALGHDVEPFGE